MNKAIELYTKETVDTTGWSSLAIQQGYCEAKYKKIIQLDTLDLELLECALSIYKKDMCKPKHHTTEKINHLRDKIKILRDKGR